ncbi:MAG: hypothetical protein WC797_02455, partial [Candidatus Paceibacterota bacterium]
MKVSYNWLQDLFEKKLPPVNVVAEEIIMHSFEVESIDEVEVFGEKDWVLDVKVLPNRGHDCNCHVGIAKEIAILFDLPLKVADRDRDV